MNFDRVDVFYSSKDKVFLIMSRTLQYVDDVPFFVVNDYYRWVSESDSNLLYNSVLESIDNSKKHNNIINDKNKHLTKIAKKKGYKNLSAFFKEFVFVTIDSYVNKTIFEPTENLGSRRGFLKTNNQKTLIKELKLQEINPSYLLKYIQQILKECEGYE